MSTSQRVHRIFHWLGLIVAVAAFLVVLLFNLILGAPFGSVELLALITLCLVIGLVIYGIFRAIGWVIGRFMAS